MDTNYHVIPTLDPLSWKTASSVIGKNIRRLHGEKGLTQQELAESLP